MDKKTRRASGGTTTHLASPPPPAGNPTVPEAAVAALPCPAAATTNRNLRPRPLTEANAQPNLLTAPPQPSIRANGKAPKTPPTSSGSQCRESARAWTRARAPRPLCSCSIPPSQRLLVSCVSSPARARARRTSARTSLVASPGPSNRSWVAARGGAGAVRGRCGGRDAVGVGGRS